MPEPIPVVAGFGWTAAGAWGSFLLLLGVIVRQVGPWRKLSINANEKLRDDLLARIALQDARIEAQDVLMTREREDCHRQINRLEAQIQIFRHARNNADARFQALLILLKRNPEDVPGTIALIEEMVASQDRALAAEKGAMAGAASLWAASPVEKAAEQAVQATKDTLAEVQANNGEAK